MNLSIRLIALKMIKKDLEMAEELDIKILNDLSEIYPKIKKTIRAIL